MCRLKPELEKGETPEMEARRLRLALFYAWREADQAEAKRICMAAMGGNLHGHETTEADIKSEHFARSFQVT